jgi:2-methylcitrate dehydratase PrpD
LETEHDVTLTSRLADHFSTTSLDRQPTSHVHEMKRLLIDYVGIALCGSQTDSGRIAGEFAAGLGGVEQATVIGRAKRVPAVHAAFANAISQHSIELDDVDEEALFHYAPPIMSATLAVAQQVDASGASVLNAALSGAEMMARLSRATNSELRDRGFHTTPTCGVFGATVAAGRLLELSGAQMTSALGLAGAQASGLMEMYGTSMQKRFNPGPAARNGVTAAQMAKLGFTGADTILDGERGFGPAFAGKLDASYLLDGLGTDVPVIVEYKPYSCARPIHNAIDCALALRPGLDGRLDDIERIVMHRHPTWEKYHVIARPRSYHEAQVSLPYSVAVALVDGAALPAQYTDERVENDKQVQGLAALVQVEADPSLARGVSCHMVVTLRTGEALESTVDYPLGSVQNPMNDDVLIAKSRTLATPVIGAQRFDQFVELALGFDKADSVGPLFDVIAVD